MAGRGEGDAFAVHVDESGYYKGVGEEADLDAMGVDGGGQAREVESGRGLDSEREDEGVEREIGGGEHTVEEGKGLFRTAFSDVRLHEPGAGQQTLARAHLPGSLVALLASAYTKFKIKIELTHNN